MIYYYRIADIGIQMNLPYEIDIGIESKEFILDEPLDCVDERIDFEDVPMITYEGKRGHWEVFSLYLKEDGQDVIYHCNNVNQDAYACIRWSRIPGKEHTICKYRQEQEKNIRTSHSICNALGLEQLLLRHNSLILHSSFIRWNEEGILFSAPSGTGKSTQADLWKQYEAAEIINGDRSALRKREGTWYAYGLPYAGSSGIYRNEKAPVKAIVLLEQADENRIRKVSFAEAIAFLYPEFTIHRWDNTFSEKALDLMLDIVREIPIYMLACRPDKDAVELLKSCILE